MEDVPITFLGDLFQRAKAFCVKGVMKTSV